MNCPKCGMKLRCVFSEELRLHPGSECVLSLSSMTTTAWVFIEKTLKNTLIEEPAKYETDD